MTDRDVVLAAADMLARLDGEATAGPWELITEGGQDYDGEWWAQYSVHTAADPSKPVAGLGEDEESFADAALIVALRPVAAPLAAWLRDVAERHVMWHLVGAGLPVCAICRKWPCPDFTSALSVARAVTEARRATRRRSAICSGRPFVQGRDTMNWLAVFSLGAGAAWLGFTQGYRLAIRDVRRDRENWHCGAFHVIPRRWFS